LPLGSYVPEFLLRTQGADEAQRGIESERLSAARRILTMSRDRYRAVAFILVAMLVLAGIAGTYTFRKLTSPKPTASDELWGPFVKSTGPILIVVGTSHNLNKLVPESADTSFYDHMVGPYHHVSVATAVAVSNLAGVLKQHGNNYEIKEDNETSLTDLHSRTLILVGATNNAWTMRLAMPLRFRFLPGPMAQVQDTSHLENREWIIDFTKPYTTISTDYAIVARYHDPTTEGPVMIIGGLGPYGTEAGSAFVSTPQYLEQIVKQLPAGWENKNIEMVLKSEVIDGKAGPPVLVSSAVW